MFVLALVASTTLSAVSPSLPATRSKLAAAREKMRVHKTTMLKERSATVDGWRVMGSYLLKAGVNVGTGRQRDRGSERKVRVISPFVGGEYGVGFAAYRSMTQFHTSSDSRHIIAPLSVQVGWDAAPFVGASLSIGRRSTQVGFGGGAHFAAPFNVQLTANITQPLSAWRPMRALGWAKRAERVAEAALKAESSGNAAYAEKALRLLDKADKRIIADQFR